MLSRPGHFISSSQAVTGGLPGPPQSRLFSSPLIPAIFSCAFQKIHYLIMYATSENSSFTINTSLLLHSQLCIFDDVLVCLTLTEKPLYVFKNLFHFHSIYNGI